MYNSLQDNISAQKRKLDAALSLTLLCKDDFHQYKLNLKYRRQLRNLCKKIARLNAVIRKQIEQSVKENIPYFKL